MALPADWVDFGGGQIYRQTQDGFAPVSQDELAAYQYQEQNQGRDPQAQADYQYTQKSFGALDGVQMLTPDQQAAVNAGTFTPPAGMGVYNAGNGVQALVPLGDPRFIAAPQHNDSFATFPSGIVGTTLTHIQDTRNAYQKNPERLLQGGGPADTPIGTALTNSALGTNYAPTVNQTGGPTQQTYDNAAAAGYQTGPTETGHTLAPAIVGIGLAGGLVSGAEGAGTLAGTSDAAALTGTAAGDTALGGSGFVGDIPLAGEGGTSIYGAGSGAGSGGTGMWDWLDGYQMDPETGDVFGNANPGNFDPSMAGGGEVGSGYPSSAPGTQSPSSSLLDSILKYGKQGKSVADLLKGLVAGGVGRGGGPGGGTVGGGVLGSAASDPLGAAFSATPFLLALNEANSQGKDLNGVLNQINGEAYTKSVLNPYDKDTGMGRYNLQNDLGLRGVSGSSFGQQSLDNYDYTRALGRSDMATKAQVATAGLQGSLINQRNTNRNLILGAGLSASGKLFSPQPDPFGLNNILGLSALSGILGAQP